MGTKFVIGSGWWCSEPAGAPAGMAHGLKIVGERCIRGLAWHNLWKRVLFKYASPSRVVIVDSASPVVPEPDGRIEWIKLDRNYHTVPGEPLNGWIRGFVMGAWHAWSCNADFAYVEQDCLVLGQGWVELCRKEAKGKYVLFGMKVMYNGQPGGWPLQQSLCYLPRHLIPRFVYEMLSVVKPRSCEERFHLGGQKVAYKKIPFGYGRSRPINFKDKVFYAQHWSRAELEKLGKREGLGAAVEYVLKASK